MVMRKDPTEFRERFKRWKQGLPAYKDGKRYIKNDDDTWTRITDDQMADQFANLVVTPNSNKEERVVRRPDTYDALLRKSIHDAGYVTDWALERDAANRRKVAMAARHVEDPLETVSPEFDILMMGAGLRSNPLTQQLWRNRTLSKEMNKVFDEGLLGATKDMPTFKASDMYNPEHFRSTAKYNIKQIGSNQHHYEASKDNVGISIKSHTPELSDLNDFVPEATYTGRTPRRSYDLRDLQAGAAVNHIPSSGNHFNPTTPAQRPVTPRKLLPLNPKFEYVDSEGNVNMRNVVKAVRRFYESHPEARNYKEIMNWRDMPYPAGRQQRNLFQHISDVVKSAQQAPIPEGHTRQELVQAALFHDIGKVLNPDKSHGETSVDILKQMGIHVNYDVKHAIKRHMSHHLGDEDPLTKALHFVDVVRDTEPMSNVGAYDTYRYLLYPSNTPYKIKPIYTWDTDWQLNNIINPILRKYGYDEIPLGLSKDEARKQVLERAQEHRRFARGQHVFNSENLKNATEQFVKREGRYPTEEELFDQGFEYFKEHGTSSGDRGASKYMDKFELPYKKYMSLYTSNSDEVYRSYLRNTSDDYAARAIELPVQDNPDWSLAELWGYNDYPIVYSPGNRTPTWDSDWRYNILPNILEGRSTPEGFISMQEAKEINDARIQNAKNEALFNAINAVKEGYDKGKYFTPEHKDAGGGYTYNGRHVPVYSDIRPSVFMEASTSPKTVTKLNKIFADPNDNSEYSITGQIVEPGLVHYGGLSTAGWRNPFMGIDKKPLSEAVRDMNEFLKKHGIPEIIPYSYSQLKPRKKESYLYGSSDPANYRNTVLKYPIALRDLLYRIQNIKEVFDGTDIPAHIPLRMKKGKPLPKKDQMYYMTPAQIQAHNNANKPRVTKDGLVVNTPIFVPTDMPNPYTGEFGDFVATNTKYIPDVKKVINDAIKQYFKDIRLARSKDAFVRRTLLDRDVENFVNNAGYDLKEQFYKEPELIKPSDISIDQIDYPFTTQSFDGYRVFVTEHGKGPGFQEQNNYILVGPRGAKAATINKGFKLQIDNHGYTRGHDNIGGRMHGFTKNAK